MPIPSGVVFPEMVVTIALESDEATAAADAATGGELVLVPRIDGRYATVGTVARIEDRGTLGSGTPALTIRATHRAVIGGGVAGAGDALWVEVTPVKTIATDRTPVLAKRYRDTAKALLASVGGRSRLSLPPIDDPGQLADTVAYWPDLSVDQRVELLETIDIDDRLTLATRWAAEALADLEVASSIRRDVADGVEKDQREAVLRRQLAAIQAELGEDATDVVAEFRARLDALEQSVTTKAHNAIAAEIDRLERAGEQSQEGGWIRAWLDTTFEVPFGEISEERIDLDEARSILDRDHTGLDDVKERIVEHLAVRRLRLDRGIETPGAAAILTLVGPPGVGKTSLGESVAEALGRGFVRLALGGIRDEAEIRGHRRTYVGARPGRLVKALTEAGTMNPVILLDELDKVGSDYRGDPSAALLEVLDPAQNHSFRDHYLEFELDLSQVVFIATAIRVDTIPGPLLDRVELIEIDGYTDAEKMVIGRRHVLPRVLREAGLADGDIEIADEALAAIVADWTRDAGMRTLERHLAKVARKAATRVVEDPHTVPIVIDIDEVRAVLGRPIPRDDLAGRSPAPGVATGLAVTGAGGDVLFVEATHMPGEPGLTLTGQLGDVMKESGELARSYLRSHATEWGIDDADRRFHVHFPAGAVPKDGPSAGVTMTTALVSLLTGRPVRPQVAMTGEISLHGQVLPIGGVKQKLLAAHRAGITEVILPAKNGDELEDVPAPVRDALTVHLVDNVDQVLAIALER
jgi:ATP-dependent Lon protease